ncbi:MAG: EpsG family protein [Erysipelotrichaceae bacterium]|nr:EpsG family protein [Erysipelotrichaceae bacterium]
MIFYSLLAVGIAFIGPFLKLFIKNKKVERLIEVILCFGVLFAVSAIKADSVGTDTQAYIEAFNAITSKPFFELRYRSFEPGFVLLYKIFGVAHIPFRGFQIFLYLFVYGALGLFVWKYSKNISFSAFMLIGIGIFGFNLSGQRQALAMAICLIGLFVYLQGKRIFSLIAFIIIVLIGCLFHVTSFVMLLALFMRKRPLGLKEYVILMFLVFLVFLLSPSFYQFVLHFVISSVYYPITTGGGGRFFALTFVGLFLFIILKTTFVGDLFVKLLPFTKKFDDKEVVVVDQEAVLQETQLKDYMFFLFIVALLFESFSTVSNQLTRASMYFMQVFVVLLPNIIASKKNKIYRICLYVGFFAIFFFLFYLTFIRNSSVGIYPYSIM